MPAISTAASSGPLRVLVAGAGVAGPIMAYWLSKGGAQVTVIERAAELRREGQTVDLRGEGVEVIRRMGIEKAIRAHTTQEKGLAIVDSKGRWWGAFPENGDSSFTSDIEIVRGELAKTLYEQTCNLPGVKYIFSETIAAIDDGPDNVTVTFSSDGQKRQFDILVVAEGLTSRTRAMAFNEPVRAGIRELDMFIAGYSIPATKVDSEWAQLHSLSGGRGLLIRPDGTGRTSVCMVHFPRDRKTLEELQVLASSKTPVEAQMAYFKRIFADAAWEVPRFLREMDNASDFYLQEIGQGRRASWSTGRVVLVGDSGYCPSLLTGRGTTVAVAGAYVLADEIIKNGRDHRTALQSYEKRLRPWVEDIQHLNKAGIRFAYPSTTVGIYFRNAVLAVMTGILWLGAQKIINRFVGGKKKKFDIGAVEQFGKSRDAI